MAAITTANFTAGTGQYFASGAISGAPNLRASHSFGMRLKNGSTSTTIDSIAAAYVMNSGSDGSGSYFGRNNGVTSTGMNVYRSNALGTTFDLAVRSTCYGNTTTWYHLAYVYNATTGQIRFYINGAFIAQHASVTTRTTSTTNCVFGLAQHPGKYADAFLFNRLLSDAEVTSMYDYRVPQVTGGLIGFWRLDSNANDSSGAGNNLGTTGTGTAISYSTADNPPQPEAPIVNITASASATTSATAAVTRSFNLASSASTSTSATAAVSVSNVASTAATRSPGWGDLMRANGAESYRFPPYSGSYNLSSASGPASGAASRTFMAWLRWYERSPENSVGGSATVRVFGSGGTDTPWTMTLQSSTTLGVGPIINGSITTSVGFIAFRTSATLDYNWHHATVTYDGTDFKLFIDGVQAGASITATLPFDDTSTAANLVLPIHGATVTPFVDVAHMKFWSGVALDATDIASEMAAYRPVTNLASMRGYWPMSWSNPQWEAWGNVMTLHSGILHALDDGNYGPNGTWPPVGVAGVTQTVGTAAVNRVYALGACTGSATTSATAAVAKVIAATASSSTTTAGTATVALENNAAASTQTSASAAVSLGYDFGSTAATNTSASAAVTKTQLTAVTASTQTSGTVTGIATSAALVPTGNAATEGVVALEIVRPISASGAASTQGSAALNPVISASSSTSTNGTAAITADAAIVATGATQTLASANNQGALIVNAQTRTDGLTSFDTVIQPKTADGPSATTGTAAFGTASLTLVPTGQTATIGSAAITSAAGIAASGQAATQGTAQLTLIAGGLSRTQGLADVASAAGLASSGSSSTVGQAAIGFGIVPAGEASTTGVATVTAIKAVSASGQCLTFGNAAFDGIVPVGGGGGGVPTSRRMLGALGTRRRIR